MPLPPIVQDSYTPQQLQYIAGFILTQRLGVLKALESVSDPTASAIEKWQDGGIRYYADAESFTRYLLWVAGYPVDRGEMYHGETTYVNP